MISTHYFHITIQKSKPISKINKYVISDFITKLSSESWDTIFNIDDVKAM